MIKRAGKKIAQYIKNKIGASILNPLDQLVDENLTEISTIIGSFVIKSITGKYTRSITFTSNGNQNKWMEEALFGILHKYNDIRKKSNNLELANLDGSPTGSGMYYRLGDGSHHMKYRKYDIILIVKTINHSNGRLGIEQSKEYQIISYNLDPNFVTNFEKDMLIHRNDLMKIRSDSTTINVYQDYPEINGNVYWVPKTPIPKRKLNTIYLPAEIKHELITTINNFVTSKEKHRLHGIPWNLKIVLAGATSTGKDSIVKMIASEYNRNIFYITGNRHGGKLIPSCLTETHDNIHVNPLFLISDIDKFPFLINEADIKMKDDGIDKSHSIEYKRLFGEMINALDGVGSGEGKIIIMTTNHLEKFSPVFLRPGRINLTLKLPCVQPEVFRKWMHDHLGVVLPKEIKLKSDDFKISEMQLDLLTYELTADDFIQKYCK
jgi:ATP-dependent 26S proteasome regulatory subunit